MEKVYIFMEQGSIFMEKGSIFEAPDGGGGSESPISHFFSTNLPAPK